MAGASRLLRGSRALQSDLHPSSSSSSSPPNSRRLPCPNFPTGGGEKRIPPGCRVRKRAAVPRDAAVISPGKKREPAFFGKGADVARLALDFLGPPRQEAARGFRTARSEMLVETGIAGCQSFTLIAVAGSLLGSVLCFVEGCFLVLEAFFEYFRMTSQRLDQGGIIIQRLVGAIGTFLVGTALLTFGIGSYVMFSGSAGAKRSGGRRLAESSLGSFNLQKLARSMEMRSISEAKSRIGHAVLLVLQTGVLEKLKDVPLASGLDLACFAGAVFISSACVFLLSKLTTQGSKTTLI